jgi:hypothetical protein
MFTVISNLKFSVKILVLKNITPVILIFYENTLYILKEGLTGSIT